jgi:NitT/TauT family transport system ATP-binding protein
VLEALEIDEPYPRDDSFRVSPQFAGYSRALQGLLAQASGAGEAQ